MKDPIECLDVDSLAWTSTGIPGVFERILNVDRDTGARTLLLKSLSRPKKDLVDRRPQFHPVAEEFYCLSGDFTLEGNVWLRDHSYVYYPPGLVHGHGVDVPNGYEIYLRNSGPISTERVNSPRSNALHFADGNDAGLSKVAVSNAGARIEDARRRPSISIILLRKASDDSGGAFLLTLPKGARTGLIGAERSGSLEVFVLTGQIELAGRVRLQARNYSFLPQGAAPLEIKGLAASSTLLVNYAHDSQFNQFAEDASVIVMADDLKPCS